MIQKTIVAKRETMGEDWDRKWYVVDAKGQTLGRLASQIAVRLMGKHKPMYTPHVDVGDNIIVINAEQIRVTGRKRTQKMYRHYSGYQSGMRERSFQAQIERHPTAPLYDAVRRMFPRNKLSRQMIKKLKVYAGPDHPHEVQNPEPLNLVT